jgi:hypothetical protein
LYLFRQAGRRQFFVGYGLTGYIDVSVCVW